MNGINYNSSNVSVAIRRLLAKIPQMYDSNRVSYLPVVSLHHLKSNLLLLLGDDNFQGRIQDLIRGGGGGPDRDRPKTAILGPQFCRILVLGPHFWWSGGGPGPRTPPWIRP